MPISGESSSKKSRCIPKPVHKNRQTTFRDVKVEYVAQIEKGIKRDMVCSLG